MNAGGKKYVFMGVVCSVVIFLMTIFTIYVGDMAASSQSPVFKWTEQNPKPKWWNLETRPGTPVRGGYYRSASSQYIGLMNPNHWPVLDWGAITFMYDGIAYIDMTQNPAGLWLAESYEYTDDVTCLMKLRAGIDFHDGTPFNAEAVKFTIDYIKEKNNGCWSRAWIEPIKSVEVVNELTLKWNFKRPWAGFMGMMATVPGYIISKKALEGDIALKSLKKVEKRLRREKAKLEKLEKGVKGSPDDKTARTITKAKKKVAEYEDEVADLSAKAEGAKDLDKFPVGTGSFMLEEGKPGNYLKLKRNPNWWFGKAVGMDMPFFDGRMTIVIPDEAVRLANLRAGKLDSLGLSSVQYMDMKGDPDFIITNYVLNFMAGLNFNQAKGPCQDIRVRKAISHAIDRKAIVAGLVHGQGITASGPYHSAHWCHNPNLKPVEYNPELSKKLLKEAGYAKGLVLEGYIGTTSGDISRAEAVKAMLSKVGITWKVDSLDAAASSDRAKNLEYDLSSGGAGYIKEPDMIATNLYHPSGTFHAGRNNIPEAIALIEQGRAELDMKKRQKIYWKLEEVLYENYADVWLYYPLYAVARSQRIMGFDIDRYRKGGEYYHFSHRRWFKDGRNIAD